MSTLFHRNPRLLVTVVGLLVVAGLASLKVIVRQEDPTITNGVAVVVTPYPGASAERVESLVTDKLEDELRELPEIAVLSSTSRNGVSVVAIEIDERIQGDAVEEAFSHIRDAIDDARRAFPAGVLPPIFDDERFGSYALIAGLTWDEAALPPRPGILRRFAEDLQDRLRDVDGTDSVRVFGAPAEEISVVFDPDALAATGLTASQVTRSIALADAKVAAGVLRAEQRSILIELTGELDSLERVRRVPLLSSEDGAQLTVGDLARVERGQQDPPTDLAIVDGRPAVVVAARLAEGTRFDEWARAANAALREHAELLPHGVGLTTVFDQTEYTARRIEDLIGNLLSGLALVLLVLLLSLGLRSALIVAATLPLVSLAAITALLALGVPIHQMSVTGLIVALGLLVDNAIVMVDAIRTRRLAGRAGEASVRSAIGHLWAPLLSSTVTTVLAFLPILLLSGRVGEFVGAIGLSVIIALSLSYLLAMSVVPALAARFLKPRGSAPSVLGQGLSLPWLGRLFDRTMALSLRHPRSSIALASVLPLLGVLGATTLSRQFFPPADRDQFHIELRLPEGASIEHTRRAAARVDAVLAQHSDVQGSHWFIGRSAPPFYYNLKQEQDGNPSYAQGQVRVASIERVQALLPELQRELDQAVPEAQVLVRELLQGPPVDAPVELRVYGADIEVLRELGEQLRERMARVPEIRHSLSTLTAGSTKLFLHTDEEEARLAGYSLVQLAGQLATRLSGGLGGSMLEGSEEIPVRVRLAGPPRRSLQAMLGSNLVAPGAPARGAAEHVGVPLESLARAELRPVLDAIPHRNGRRVNVVRGFTDAGVFPESANQGLQRVLAEDPIDVPAGYSLEVGGDAEKRGKAMQNLFAFVPVLVLAMVAVVALSLGSFRLSLVVLAVALQSVGLGLLSLTVLGHPLGFQALIGLIGLVGVAINAAIVINSALREQPRALAGDADAVRQVVVGETSRHIVSTTITTFGGFLPLILSSGGFWPPFASGIAGGVLLSTVLSFYFVPAAFLLVTRARPLSSARAAAAQPRPATTLSPPMEVLS